MIKMLDLFFKILSLDSTSGREKELADYLRDNLKLPGAVVEEQLTSQGTKNLFFKIGTPKIIFCTHLDTVPPYVAPRFDEKTQTVFGRGSCDAKGQIIAMAEACRELIAAGATDFGLLLVAGEETDSHGAIFANEKIVGAEYVIIGEPTENKLITFGKGTFLVSVKVSGKSAHSGYPELGDDAIKRALLFLQKVAALVLPVDPNLGATTYNVGKLQANNAFNVLADSVTFDLFFRTTFASADFLKEQLKSFADDKISLDFKFANPPIKFHTLPGFATNVVAFGSDAQRLTKLGKRLLYGPGLIHLAHRLDEKISLAEIERAIDDLQKIYYALQKQL